MSEELRDYQWDAITALRRSIQNRSKSICLVMPTGSGKSAVACEMIRSSRDKGRASAFLAPRRELIYQTSGRLDTGGISHGVIMAGEDPALLPSVQVACIPTLHARAIQRQKIHLPRADLVIVDEAHIGVGGRAESIIKHYRDNGAIIVGLTATPARSDGVGLGQIYDDLVMGPSIDELTQMGYLVPSRYFAGAQPDLEGVSVNAGDYAQGELAGRTDKPKLIGDVVENWARLAPERQTFVFAVNVAHSRHLCDEFHRIGVAAEHIDGQTDHEERAAIQQRLRDGETQVIVNCQIMTYGVDFPPVSCIVLACPTKSITKYMQMVGRGLRPSPGKQDCMVLDHAGAIDEIGFVDDPIPWSLDGKEKVQDRMDAEPPKLKEIECRDCGAIFRAQKTCPNCGKDMAAKHKKAVEAHEAELVEIDRQKRRSDPRRWTMDEKAHFFGELRSIAYAHGYKPGWIANQYRERVGAWPNDRRIKEAPHKPVSLETQRWVDRQKRRFAKGKKA